MIISFINHFPFTTIAVNILVDKLLPSADANEGVISPLTYGHNKVNVAGKVLEIPDKLQSPALELSEKEIDYSVSVFKHSLSFLKNYPGHFKSAL